MTKQVKNAANEIIEIRKELDLAEPKITGSKNGWRLVKHMESHRDLEFLKTLVFIWPQLLKNKRIRYVIDHNYTPPSGEFFLWFTERLYRGSLQDVIDIRIQDLPNTAKRAIPSDTAIEPYPDWQLYKLEDIEINSYQEGDIKNTIFSQLTLIYIIRSISDLTRIELMMKTT